MTAQEYILSRLEGIKTKHPGVRPENGLADFIYSVLMSKKFRKYTVSPKGIEKLHAVIGLNIKNDESIKIFLPPGAYKLWRFPESPEADWAELFAMIYYSYWLRPITVVYKPGVWFDFCSSDAILEIMNNIPTEDTEKYKQSFTALIKFIQSYLPENLKFTFNPASGRFNSQEDFLADLNRSIEELKQQGLPALTENQIQGIKLNIKPKPGFEIDFEKNRLIHDAFMRLDRNTSYYRRPDKIGISATAFGDKITVPIGTTKTSVVKFQTGVGVLKKTADGFIEYIYSPSQVERAKFEWENVELPGLNGKNFKKIRVIA